MPTWPWFWAKRAGAIVNASAAIKSTPILLMSYSPVGFPRQPTGFRLAEYESVQGFWKSRMPPSHSGWAASGCDKCRRHQLLWPRRDSLGERGGRAGRRPQSGTGRCCLESLREGKPVVVGIPEGELARAPVGVAELDARR